MNKLFNECPIAGGFNPLSIANCILWLKAGTAQFQDSAFTIPSVANNDPVGGWKDQSTGLNHVVQTTNSKRPGLSTGSLNGYSGVSFDGVDDFLNASVPWTGGTFNTCTTFIVFVTNTISVSSLLCGEDNTADSILVNYQANGDVGLYSGNVVSYPGLVSAGVYYNLIVNFNGANSNITINGALQSNSNPNQFVSGTNYLGALGGASAFLNGKIIEVIKYSVVLSAADSANVYSYLRTKFRTY